MKNQKQLQISNKRRKCKECNKPIHKSKRSDSVFCNHKCRMSFHKERLWRKHWFDFSANYFFNNL